MEDNKSTFVNRAYQRFVERNGYLPKYFNAYNCSEIKTVAPTITTYCGAATCSGCVLILERKETKDD